ncbi:MAG: penicillin acylase family protein, partial [Myxococcales bacterium]|nr:penicillin acylase family protein [Myxococcales bacterium]
MKQRIGMGMALALALASCGETTEPPTGPTLPESPVEILIDDRGIPHIYAQSDRDLFWAYGYQLASDRLHQLDMFRRFAHGRLSEVLGADGAGSVGESSLADDRFARLFDWKRWGREDAALMQRDEPEHWALTSAWVDGVNARIAEVNGGTVAKPYGFGPDELDYDPEPWTYEDVYIVQKMAGFGLDQTILFEVFVTMTERFAAEALDAVQLFKPVRDTFVLPEEERPAGAGAMGASFAPRGDDLACVAPEAAFPPGSHEAFAPLARLQHLKALGSNNWAVDGRHTKSQMPILAGDPHLGYDFSGLPYALHLDSKSAGGSFAVTGFSFVGAPGIFAGHNDRVAWTETSAFADVMDMWSVDVDGTKVRIGGDWVEGVERVETIAIRGGAEEEIVVLDVPGYGVIMPALLVGSPTAIAEQGQQVLLGWTGFAARPARYFRELMRVQDLDEFEAAVDRMPEMTYNFLAADASGFSYRVGVDIPRRNPVVEGREPWRTMDGGDPDAFWSGEMLSPAQKPHSRAESRGWIATANNDPFGFTQNGRVDDDPFYYGALFPPGWRANRIESELTRLAERGDIEVSDIQALQMDAHSNLADDLLPVVEEIHATVGTDPALDAFVGRSDIDALVQLLTVDWDRRMARDSKGALAFHAFAHFMAAAVMEDDLTLLYQRVLDAAPMYMLKIAALALEGAYPQGDLVMEEGRALLVMQALDATVTFLGERFGGVDGDYRFSDMRVSSMHDAYGRGMPIGLVPTDGGESTVNVAQSAFLDAKGEVAEQWVSHWGPIERQVMTFDDDGRPRSFANYALGNVADRASPHFDDAQASWVDGQYREML